MIKDGETLRLTEKGFLLADYLALNSSVAENY